MNPSIEQRLVFLAQALEGRDHQCPEAESIVGEPHGPHLWVPTYPVTGRWAVVWICGGREA